MSTEGSAQHAAKQAGEDRYQGYKCSKCGTTTRYTSSKQCVKCQCAKRSSSSKGLTLHQALAKPWGKVPEPMRPYTGEPNQPMRPGATDAMQCPSLSTGKPYSRPRSLL